MSSLPFRPPTKNKPGYRPQPVSHSPHLKSIYTEITLDWNISPPNQIYLERYYVLHWESKYLIANHPHYHPISRDGIHYLVIYHKCHPKSLESSPRVKLSFRKLYDAKYGYVLITPIS
jgi:hypothetical protein